MSGHSKWAQIKHKKAITDAKKGQLFSKIAREIAATAKTGGPNPETNSRLRSALERARSESLPKANIERAIARASNTGDTGEPREFLYEATAPGGILALIEGTTDNKNRTLSEIKHILSSHGAKLADPGSVAWNFDKIGAVEIEKSGSALSKEDLEMAIIDSGATDFSAADNSLILAETRPAELETVRQKLEAYGVRVKNASYDFKPKAPLKLGEPLQAQTLKLLAALADQNEVHEVYSNIE